MASSQPILEVDGISMDFGGLRAVSHCTFHVEVGQIYSLIGPNGAGKSTVFNVICGIYRPTEGEVRLQGKRIDGLRASRIANRGVGRSFQNLELFKGLTAAENVMVGAHRHLKYGLLSALSSAPAMGAAERKGRETALRDLEFVGIAGAADARVEDLPYGVQKKVEIARALASEPKLLLLDEPAAGLNEAETVELMGVVRRIRDELGITVLLVEHNMQLVMGISDRICALNFGVVLGEGKPEEIRAHPDVIQAYLGEGGD
ncbi:MAG: ABC transporter ATP-binding protein [Deltaproteobacteria bacterium]|nr:ABC transporter ATP-binding protein [Deltaproteobacteria bacterium]